MNGILSVYSSQSSQSNCISFGLTLGMRHHARLLLGYHVQQLAAPVLALQVQYLPEVTRILVLGDSGRVVSE